MTRYLALLGLHFLINFALLPDNAVVAHPIHHDDYANLASTLGSFKALSVRPVSTLFIAATARLGAEFAYGVMNVLLVACVFLCLRFAELFVRRGEPLPWLGYLSAGAIALGFAAIVDWTKYFGLLTNLTSAVLGLAALCLLASLDNDPSRRKLFVPAALALATLSFFAKEDFALPLLTATGCIALARRNVPWVGMTAALGALFVAAILFNRALGSAFVSGQRSPTDPYFIDLSPGSLVRSFARLLLGSAHARWIVALSLLAVLVAALAHRHDLVRALKYVALPVIACSLLIPNAIFPNHIYPYYAFVPLALLAASLAVAAYGTIESRRAI